MKTTLFAALLISSMMTQSNASSPAQFAGNWIGEVDTPIGQMEIALSLTLVKDRLTGVLKTGHGDWPVTRVTEKGGVWTVEMKSPDGPATMSGRIDGTTYAGDWRTPATTGKFEMVRSKK